MKGACELIIRPTIRRRTLQGVKSLIESGKHDAMESPVNGDSTPPIVHSCVVSCVRSAADQIKMEAAERGTLNNLGKK